MASWEGRGGPVARPKSRRLFRTGSTKNSAAKAVREIQQILWPGGNADAEWSSDTIENVAMALERHGFGAHRHLP